MNDTKKLVFRAVGMVVASFLTITVTAGPADAAGRDRTAGGINVIARDSGWD